MRFHLWKGFHGDEIYDLIRKTWEKEDCLILYPPKKSESDFITVLKETTFQEKPVYGIFSTGTTGQKLVLYSKKNIESSLMGKIRCKKSRLARRNP